MIINYRTHPPCLTETLYHLTNISLYSPPPCQEFVLAFLEQILQLQCYFEAVKLLLKQLIEGKQEASIKKALFFFFFFSDRVWLLPRLQCNGTMWAHRKHLFFFLTNNRKSSDYFEVGSWTLGYLGLKPVLGGGVQERVDKITLTIWKLEDFLTY